ncbi:MAG: helix-turn-helix domain-containing protein [Limisphaerales bacterium]
MPQIERPKQELVVAKLKRLCESHNLSNTRLVELTGLSKGLISQMFNGKKITKATLNRILRLVVDFDANDRRDLARAAGFLETQVTEDELGTLILQKLHKIGDDPTILSTRRRLLWEALDFQIKNWEDRSRVHVRAAIIPMAGWQRQLLSPEFTAELLRHAIIEAAFAKIKRLVVVISQGQDTIIKSTAAWTATRRLINDKQLRVDFLVQPPKPSGPGGAVLAGADHLRVEEADEPFVTIFPDEFTQEWCVNHMIEVYEREQKQIVAIQNIARREIAPLHGIAHTKESASASAQIGSAHVIDALEENPSSAHRFRTGSFRVFGRYILTAKFTRILRKEGEENSEAPLFLTNSLNTLAKGESVLGIVAGAELQPLRGLREEMKKGLENLQSGLDRRISVRQKPARSK